MDKLDKLSLLIVDDDHDLLDMLVEGVVNNDVSKKLGGVFSANSVKKALKIMNEQHIDIIMSDIKIPGEDGISLLRKAKQKDPSVIVIMMTGYNDISYAIKAVKENAFEYIEKPIVGDVFESTIVRAFRQKQQERMIQRAREQSMENEKIASLGIMSTSIANEIANPLSAIKSYCTSAISSLENEKDLELVKENISQIQHMVSTIDGITLGLKHMFLNKQEKKSSVPVKYIFDDAVNICQHKFSAKNIRFSYPELDESLKILCNHMEISQVLISLLDNACHAVENLDEKWVELTLNTGKKSLSIAVTDSGPGIPKQVARKMFEEFFTTKPVGVGTGFGLSLSMQIIKEHGGKLELDKACRHTRFTFSLPFK